MYAQGRASSANAVGGAMKQGGRLEKVWQQRGQALAPRQEWNPVHSYIASSCNMNMAASLFSAPLQKFSFHQNLLRDSYLPKEDWRGHGLGKCTWSSFKLNKVQFGQRIIKRLGQAGYTEAVLRILWYPSLCWAVHLWPPFRALTQQKNKITTWSGGVMYKRETHTSLLNHLAPPSSATWDRKRWCVWRVVFKKTLSKHVQNSFFLTTKKHFQILCCDGVFQKHLCI